MPIAAPTEGISSRGSDGPVPCGKAETATTDMVAVTTKTQCYVVHGTTWDEVNLAIHEKGPDVAKVDAVAVTDWKIGADYVVVDRTTSCAATQIAVHLDLRYEYPRIHPDPVGTLAVQWAGYLASDVIPHEEHHGVLALDGARRLLRELRQLPDSVTCDIMRASLSSAVSAVIADTRKKQDAFDHREYGG